MPTQPKPFRSNTVPGCAPIGGMALSFDGQKTFVDCGEWEKLDPLTSNSEFTIEAWFFSEESTAPGYIVSRPDRRGMPHFALATSNRPSLWLFGVSVEVPMNVPFYYRTWYHLAGTSKHIADEHGLELWASVFLNGEPCQSLPIPAPDRAKGAVYLGSLDYEAPGTYFGGPIQNVRYWNGALTPEQIQWSMRTTLTGPVALKEGDDEIHLLANWRCDAGYGGVAFDDSGNGNDGRLGGGDPSKAPSWIVSTLNRHPRFGAAAHGLRRAPLCTSESALENGAPEEEDV